MMIFLSNPDKACLRIFFIFCFDQLMSSGRRDTLILYTHKGANDEY